MSRRRVPARSGWQFPTVAKEYDAVVPQVSQLPLQLPEIMSEQFVAQLLNRTIRCLRDWHARRIGPPRITFQQVFVYKRDSFWKWLQKYESKSVRLPK